MSVPNSILSVLLVVVWLFVLVPMFVNRRPKVMTVSQTALNTRILFRGGLDKLKHRIRPGVAGDAPMQVEDEEAEESSARRPVAEIFADEQEDLAEQDLAAIEEAEFVEEAAPRRAREEEVVDEAEIVPVREAKQAHGAREDDEADLDEERITRLAHRLGRGGYNPTADASARAQRYATRQRIVLGLLVALIASTVLALAMTPLVWAAVVVLAATLIGYLGYLRQQVRIEERIRARRMSRFARAQGPRTDEEFHQPRAQEREAARDHSAPQRPARKARGPQIVARDEDDPDFVFLPSPQEHRMRRASGE